MAINKMEFFKVLLTALAAFIGTILPSLPL